MVMEYAEGGNLADLLLKNRVVGRRFSPDQILMYAAQLTLALLAVHSNQILHRDVKPQNIYIKEGVLKLGGFGVAKALASESDMAEGKCGTPYYMPPEVCSGLAYDSKVDVWALGVVIFELITFRKPFTGNDINSLFRNIANKPLEPLPSEAGGDLSLLVQALLTKDRDSRPSIQEVAQIACIKDRIVKFAKEHDCADALQELYGSGMDRKPKVSTEGTPEEI